MHRNGRGLVAEPPSVPNAVWIEVGQGQFALVDDTHKDLSAFIWSLDKQGYAVRMERLPDGRQRRRSMHRVVFNLDDEDIGIDHRNGKTLDNRKNNLRLATTLQNARNKRKSLRRGESSSYKGVHFKDSSQRWNAMIEHVWLGSFATEQEAAQAYDNAARIRFGEFACVNFPKSGERGIREGGLQ
jgi:hypothetical protein